MEMNKGKNKIEQFTPLPKNICPECKRDMMIVRGNFKCFKCGIEIENA